MKRRPDRKEIRRQEAQERQAACDKLSPEQRLANLDTLFGEGVGATKERVKLHAQIAAREEAAS
jgi:hypothetical protein